MRTTHDVGRVLLHRLWALVAIVVAAPAAVAQEAPLTPAATQPAKGRFTLRLQHFWTRYLGDDRDVSEFRTDALITYGLRRDVSLSLRVPTIVRDDLAEGSLDDDSGLGDLSLDLKWRFWQADSQGLNTTRLALLAGIEAPTGTGDLSSHSWDPSLGLVFTMVRGRHGFNQSLRYQLNTGTVRDNLIPGGGADDLLEIRSAYLFRLAPAQFTADSHDAWYLTMESEVFYETSGDTEWLLLPGILYEGSRWAAELGVRLPIAQDVSDRPEIDLGLYAGLRFLF